MKVLLIGQVKSVSKSVSTSADRDWLRIFQNSSLYGRKMI